MSEALWANEFECENNIRELLCEKVIPLCNEIHMDIYIMVYKGIADIIICRNGDCPKLFFIEVKYFKHSNGRVGPGDGKGESIQVEILIERPKYFEKTCDGFSFMKKIDLSMFYQMMIADYMQAEEVSKKVNRIISN